MLLKYYFYSPDRIGQGIIIKECVRIRGYMLNYTLPFLVALIGFSYNSWQKSWVFGLFLIFMFLFLRKDQSIMLNPMFLLLGINLYRIKYNRTGAWHENILEVLAVGGLAVSGEVVQTKEIDGIGFVLKNKSNKITN